jgi:putative Holliday junction resolvase
MRILGVDPGEKNIGIAISDPTGTIARPLTIIEHISKQANAERISALAEEQQINLIVIGQATDIDGKPNFSGRKSARLAGEIRSMTEIPVELWDESYSTYEALETRIKLGVPLKARQGHLDEIAASIILQTYLDAHPSAKAEDEETP